MVIEAKTDETTLAVPIQLKIAVNLKPKLDSGIVVSPSLGQTFNMTFDEAFEQVFTFERTNGGDNKFSIDAHEHPFIKTKITSTNTLLITVNGPEALSFINARTNQTESLTILVDEEFSFKFKILLLREDPTRN